MSAVSCQLPAVSRQPSAGRSGWGGVAGWMSSAPSPVALTIVIFANVGTCQSVTQLWIFPCPLSSVLCPPSSLRPRDHLRCRTGNPPGNEPERLHSRISEAARINRGNTEYCPPDDMYKYKTKPSNGYSPPSRHVSLGSELVCQSWIRFSHNQRPDLVLRERHCVTSCTRTRAVYSYLYSH
jgi:hypothetical protein